MVMTDYTNMTDQEFTEVFEELVHSMEIEDILSIGDVNTILREELNNEVLDIWKSRKPDEAF